MLVDAAHDHTNQPFNVPKNIEQYELKSDTRKHSSPLAFMPSVEPPTRPQKQRIATSQDHIDEMAQFMNPESVEKSPPLPRRSTVKLSQKAPVPLIHIPSHGSLNNSSLAASPGYNSLEPISSSSSESVGNLSGVKKSSTRSDIVSQGLVTPSSIRSSDRKRVAQTKKARVNIASLAGPQCCACVVVPISVKKCQFGCVLLSGKATFLIDSNDYLDKFYEASVSLIGEGKEIVLPEIKAGDKTTVNTGSPMQRVVLSMPSSETMVLQVSIEDVSGSNDDYVTMKLHGCVPCEASAESLNESGGQCIGEHIFAALSPYVQKLTAIPAKPRMSMAISKSIQDLELQDSSIFSSFPLSGIGSAVGVMPPPMRFNQEMRARHSADAVGKSKRNGKVMLSQRKEGLSKGAKLDEAFYRPGMSTAELIYMQSRADVSGSFSPAGSCNLMTTQPRRKTRETSEPIPRKRDHMSFGGDPSQPHEERQRKLDFGGWSHMGHLPLPAGSKSGESAKSSRSARPSTSPRKTSDEWGSYKSPILGPKREVDIRYYETTLKPKGADGGGATHVKYRAKCIEHLLAVWSKYKWKQLMAQLDTHDNRRQATKTIKGTLFWNGDTSMKDTHVLFVADGHPTVIIDNRIVRSLLMDIP